MVELALVSAALRRISAGVDAEVAVDCALGELCELLDCPQAMVAYSEAGRARVRALGRGEEPRAPEVSEAVLERLAGEPDDAITIEGSRVRAALVHEGSNLGLVELDYGEGEGHRASALAEGSLTEVLRALVGQLALALVNAERYAELRASESQVWAILNSIESVVFIKDLDGRYILANRQLLVQIGLSREQVLGRTDHELFVPEVADRIVRDDRQVFDSGEPGEFEGVITLPSGPRVFLTTKFPLRNRQGKIEALCGISTDISERKRAQRFEHLDVLGRLAGGISHDLNNVLMTVMASTELIDATVAAPRDARVDSALRTIAESTERASDLTHKLLSFSRESHRPKQRVELHELISAMATLLQSSDRRLELALALDASSDVILGEPTRLQAALLQLGVNAIDALEGSSRKLEISTRDVELSAERCATSLFELAPGAYLELELRDSGVGIAADVLPRIFEPYYTTKDTGAGKGSGRGLGLAAVHGTVVAHGGSVEVRSELGVGTQFFIRLPKQREAKPRRRRRTSSASRIVRPKPGAKTVLLIDDERMIRKTVKTSLEMLGYRVVLAEDGEQGVARFAEHHGDLTLVLLDMIMPKLGGAQAFHQMRDIDPRVPVVVCSGYAPGEEIEALERLGLAGFLAKPYRLAQLRELLAKLE